MKSTWRQQSIASSTSAAPMERLTTISASKPARMSATGKSGGWVDTDFAADLETRRSHTGYLLMLNGGAVSWKSTKQKSVSLSKAESEWYASSDSGKEILFLRFILAGFGFRQEKATEL